MKVTSIVLVIAATLAGFAVITGISRKRSTKSFPLTCTPKPPPPKPAAPKPAYVWDEEKARIEKGPASVLIDLSEQRVYLYKGKTPRTSRRAILHDIDCQYRPGLGEEILQIVFRCCKG